MQTLPQLQTQDHFVLHPHQVEAQKWMQQHELESDIPGGILADEMGMGKTYSLISTLLVNPLPKTLIVVPHALLSQWTQILHKFFTPSTVSLYHGSKRNSISLSQSSIVISTYSTVANDIDNQTFLSTVSWDRLVCDEAHHLRNQKTKNYNSFRSINSRIKWLLTGTPIQNSLRDIQSLFRIIGFDKKYIRDNLSAIISTHLLRRKLTSTGIEMPNLNIHNVECYVSDPQEQSLSSFIHTNLQQGNPIIYEHILPLYVKAKQTCLIPKMIHSFYHDIQSSINDDLVDVDLPEVEDIFQYTFVNSKINRLIQTIEEQPKASKKLIFCNFLEEIDDIKHHLSRYDYNVQSIDGRVPPNERPAIISNPDIDILVLQITTGSEGLNLQRYNQVYFPSPLWNPTLQSQAIARSFRCGQLKDVDVFNFISTLPHQNTLDQAIIQRQVKKIETAQIIET